MCYHMSNSIGGGGAGRDMRDERDDSLTQFFGAGVCFANPRLRRLE